MIGGRCVDDIRTCVYIDGVHAVVTNNNTL